MLQYQNNVYMASDCHRFSKPAGLQVGYIWVRVWVGVLQPSPYPYPQHGLEGFGGFEGR